MRIALAGRATLQGSDRTTAPVTLGAQAQLVLAYLTLERGRPVGRDELADVLWPGELPGSWKQLIRGAIAQVRAAMRAAGLPSTELLTTAFGSYQLDLPRGAEVDLDIAAADLAGGHARLAEGDAGAARAAAERAAAVFGRRFLPTAGGEWVEAMQTHLRDQHLQALDLLARAALAGGDAPAAVEAAEAALRVEPYREQAFVALMDAHLAIGARTSALDAYERCRRRLAEDLGVEPSSEVEALRARAASDPAGGEVAGAAGGRTGPAGTAPPPSLQVRRRGPFVGREAEVEAVRRFLDDPGLTGTCRLALLEGEPGAGKTRTAAELAAASAERGRRVLHGWCTPDGPTFAPFARLLPGLAALSGRAVPAALDALGPGPAAAAGAGPAAAPADADADADARSARLEAWVALVADAASGGPGLTLVLDDLQWASPSAVALLGHLLLVAPGADVEILATTRDGPVILEGPLPALLADLARTPLLHRCRLPALDPGAVETLVRASSPAGTAAVPLDDLLRTTDGNALFVTETLRHWAAGGTGTPPGLAEAVRSQVAHLPAGAGALLSAAAVVGTAFDLASAALLAEMSEDEVLDAVDATVAAGLLLETDEVDRWTFSHALVADVLAEQVPAARRARLHSRLGRALADRPGTEPSEVAAHLLAGLPDDRAPAARFLIRAGRRAMDQLAYDDAATAFERAADLTGATPELLLALSQARSAAGQAAEARAALLDAAELARRDADPTMLATVAVAAATRRMPKSTGRSSPTVTALLEDAAARLPPTSTRLRVTVLSLLAIEYRFTVDRHRAEPLVEEARRLAAGLDDPAIDMFISAAEESESVDPRVNLEGARRWLAAARRDGDTGHRLWATVNVVWSATGAGRLSDAREAAEDFERAVRLSGRRSQLWWPTAWEAARAIAAGELSAATPLLDEAVLTSTGPESATAAVQGVLLQLALERLRGGISPVLARQVASFRLGLDDRRRTWAFELWTRWHAGARDGIRDEVGEDPAVLLDGVPDANVLCQTGMLGEVAAAAGAPAAVRRAIAARLEPYRGCWLVYGFAGAVFGSVDRTLGLLAAADGDGATARDRLGAAAAAFEAEGAAAWAATCRADLAAVGTAGR